MRSRIEEKAAGSKPSEAKNENTGKCMKMKDEWREGWGRGPAGLRDIFSFNRAC